VEHGICPIAEVTSPLLSCAGIFGDSLVHVEVVPLIAMTNFNQVMMAIKILN